MLKLSKIKIRTDFERNACAVVGAVVLGLFSGDVDERASIGQQASNGHTDVLIDDEQAFVHARLVQARSDHLFNGQHNAIFTNNSDSSSLS
jgi:hypothetical protein